MRRVVVVGALIVLGFALCALPALAFDDALYARLLLRHTKETADTAGVRVSYAAVRRDAEWAALIAQLGSHRTKVPTERSAALAFWINAYNILVIETVARGYPVESIRDLGSPIWPVWGKRDIAVAGRLRSLDEIEHEILRPMSEPRIHAALVCASVSCPSLRREPWTADRLDEQLDSAVAEWLGDPRKGLLIDRKGGEIRLSKVLDWFIEDFGGGEDDLIRFVAARVDADDRSWLESRGSDLDVTYFEYDWRLNDVDAAPDSAPAEVAPRSSVRP